MNIVPKFFRLQPSKAGILPLLIKRPNMSPTRACPTSPNMIEKRMTKMVATNGVGSIVP